MNRATLRRDLYLMQVIEGCVHRLEVLLDHLGPFTGIGLLDRHLDLGDRLLTRQHPREGKEGGLHDGVDTPSHTRVTGHGRGIDDIELDLFIDNGLLHWARQLTPDTIGRHWAIEQEHGPSSGTTQHINVVDEVILVAGDKVGRLDQIGGTDRIGAKAQVGDGLGARLLGVIDEVALAVQWSILTNDLDAVLIGADGAIGTKSIEEGAGDVMGLDIKTLIIRQAGEGDVVVDADGEVVLGL